MKQVEIKKIVRWGLGLIYTLAGCLHLLLPAPFISIVPPLVPNPGAVVLLTGIAELLGALSLLQSRLLPLRKVAGCGLALFALSVWPANFQHMAVDLDGPAGGLGLVYHVPRLAAQPILVWLALWAGDLICWPFERAGD